jgi:hypothetical protein
MRVGLVNPLPSALAHYEAALGATLEQAGASVIRLKTTDVELNGGVLRRLRGLLSCLRDGGRLRRERGVDRIVVLWPALGYLDLLRWGRQRPAHLQIVIHDPDPLRKQVGMGRLSTRLGAGLTRRRVIAHSSAAAAALARRGIARVAVLPIPLERPQLMWRPSATVLVLGQFKHARDLGLLVALGEQLAARGRNPLICGRGWPDVPGWQVRSRFLSEEEFTELLSTAGCVLLPYAYVFQSDVAVRAAELGVPVVGPARSNLGDLFGSDWIGQVPQGARADEWHAAVEAALRQPPEEILTRAEAAYHRACAAWARWVEDE